MACQIHPTTDWARAQVSRWSHCAKTALKIDATSDEFFERFSSSQRLQMKFNVRLRIMFWTLSDHSQHIERQFLHSQLSCASASNNQSLQRDAMKVLSNKHKQGAPSSSHSRWVMIPNMTTHTKNFKQRWSSSWDILGGHRMRTVKQPSDLRKEHQII
jgi:hypothetical protein